MPNENTDIVIPMEIVEQQQHALQINAILKLLMQPDKKSRRPFGFVPDKTD